LDFGGELASRFCKSGTRIEPNDGLLTLLSAVAWVQASWASGTEKA
jgi:hypothetical protein